LSFTNEITRNLAKNASNIYNLKSSSRAYVFLFSVLYAYTFLNSDETLESRVYFNDQSEIIRLDVVDSSSFSVSGYVSSTDNIGVGVIDSINVNSIFVTDIVGEFREGDNLDNTSSFVSSKTTLSTIYFSSQPPEYSAMDDDKVYITEIPAFDITTDTGEVVFSKNEIAKSDRGTRPFKYQTITKIDMFKSTNFSENLLKTANPAGFFNEILTVIDDTLSDSYIDSKTFPKVVLTMETVE